jgi:putative transposase
MRGPQPAAVPVSDRLRGLLDRLVRRQTSPQRLIRRLQIVLAIAAGFNNDQIARQLGLDRFTVCRWRARWQVAVPRLEAAIVAEEEERVVSQRVVDALDDAPRSGAPDTFSAEQIVQIIAIACEPPPDSDRPTSHWTPEEIAAEAVNRGIVASISPRSVGRFLGSGRPQAAPEPVLAHAHAGRPGRLRRTGGDRV